MAILTNTKLVTHPEGTINLGGILNGNWETLEEIMDPTTTSGSPVFGVLNAAIRGQGQAVTTLTYDGTDQVAMNGTLLQKLVLTGDSTIELTNLGIGRIVILLLHASGATRAITWDPAINWSGDPPTSIPSGEKRIVLLHSFGTTQGDVWAGVPGGGGSGGGAPAGLSYQFNTATSGDPGSGKLLFNNATVASATAIEISETDDDANAVAGILATWDDSTSTVRGTITITDEANPAIFAVFSVTGATTDNGAYDTLVVTHVASGGTFTNNAPVRVQFSRTGNDGADGADGADGSPGAPGAPGADGTSASTGLILAFATGNFSP